MGKRARNVPLRRLAVKLGSLQIVKGLIVPIDCVRQILRCLRLEVDTIDGLILASVKELLHPRRVIMLLKYQAELFAGTRDVRFLPEDVAQSRDRRIARRPKIREQRQESEVGHEVYDPSHDASSPQAGRCRHRTGTNHRSAHQRP